MKKGAHKMRRLLDRLPAWMLTGIVLAAVLWLTLAPKPLGDTDLPLFPGADKVVHALMFGGICIAVFLDLSRGPEYRRVRRRTAWLTMAGSTLLGIVIEFIQGAMHMGRGFDPFDMLADFIGALVFTLLWLKLQKFVTL